MNFPIFQLSHSLKGLYQIEQKIQDKGEEVLILFAGLAVNSKYPIERAHTRKVLKSNLHNTVFTENLPLEGQMFISDKHTDLLAIYKLDQIKEVVQTLLSIPNKLEELNRELQLSTSDSIQTKIGIHLGKTGFVTDRDQNIIDAVGDAINVTALVKDKARPGGISATRKVIHQIPWVEEVDGSPDSPPTLGTDLNQPIEIIELRPKISENTSAPLRDQEPKPEFLEYRELVDSFGRLEHQDLIESIEDYLQLLCNYDGNGGRRRASFWMPDFVHEEIKIIAHYNLLGDERRLTLDLEYNEGVAEGVVGLAYSNNRATVVDGDTPWEVNLSAQKVRMLSPNVKVISALPIRGIGDDRNVVKAVMSIDSFHADDALKFEKDQLFLEHCFAIQSMLSWYLLIFEHFLLAE